MFQLTIELAEIKLNLELVFPQTVDKLKSFSADDGDGIYYSSSKARIEEEKLFLLQHASSIYSEDWQYEYNALFRDLSTILFDEGILVFHGVLVLMDNEGFLFTAPSGTGKSTHADLWLRNFPGQASIINGDKPLLKIKEDGVYAYGSPWNGKEDIGINAAAKLKAICLLNRGVVNHIVKLADPIDSLKWFIEQSVVKNRQHSLSGIVKWYHKAFHYFSCYTLSCNMNPDAALVAFHAMK